MELGAQCLVVKPTFQLEETAQGYRVCAQLDESHSINDVQINADWLFDASGRSATIARRQGARRLVLNRQFASVWHMRPMADPHPDLTSLVEATAQGWWYLGRNADGSQTLALFSLRAIAKQLRDDTKLFEKYLHETRHIQQRIANHRPDPQPRIVSASTERLDYASGQRWRAIGDAAISYDPLSSHGLTFALASARDAVETIHAAQQNQHPNWLDEASAHYQSIINTASDILGRESSKIYAAEQRWPQSAYWQARHAPPSHRRSM